MPEWISGSFEFLVGMYMHPGVFVVLFIIALVSRIKFELPHIQAAKDAVADAAKASPEEAKAFLASKKEEEQKAESISNKTLVFISVLSVGGQFAFYWPQNGQARALCAFFSFAQVGLAVVNVWFVEKFGLIDRLGRYFQKKADEKIGV